MTGKETRSLHIGFCALFADSPSLRAEAACSGHKHQHGFATLETERGNKYLGWLGKAEEKAGTSAAWH